ncbi:c-type cytochrome [Danxiaibacter flavus]|uniref:C-type cytochrome n=1 Tax=Danxiaibacter flavus TaxID=3049108 RepID=A0ABV3ZAN9_9BACT|nr:c-type cytochrome [Chitinophagaceae bacterium DXS]
MKRTFVYAMFALTTALIACGGGNSAGTDKTPAAEPAKEEAKSGENPSYDPKRGEGKFTHVDVPPALNAAMAENGNKTYKLKCESCHKLTEEKLVGPGWKNVTQRHAPEWIMNFVTNTDEMLNKDPAAQAQLEICLVRMPNQNLSDDEARAVYEFMRKNDGVK